MDELRSHGRYLLAQSSLTVLVVISAVSAWGWWGGVLVGVPCLAFDHRITVGALRAVDRTVRESVLPLYPISDGLAAIYATSEELGDD